MNQCVINARKILKMKEATLERTSRLFISFPEKYILNSYMIIVVGLYSKNEIPWNTNIHKVLTSTHNKNKRYFIYRLVADGKHLKYGILKCGKCKRISEAEGSNKICKSYASFSDKR